MIENPGAITTACLKMLKAENATKKISTYNSSPTIFVDNSVTEISQYISLFTLCYFQ
jgi:hypothetical protein